MRNKRCLAFAFAFIFAFIALAVPRSAFAYDYNAYTIFQNEWYEDGDIDPTQGWIIYANNKYDAALYVCGDNVSNLTDEQLSYLSDPNYGGAFYSLAQKFGTGFEHAWIPDYVRPMLALVDFDKVQVGTATTYEISQAKARLQEVMNGDYGTGGGSGGGGVDVSNIPDVIVLDSPHGSVLETNSWSDASYPNLFHALSGSIEVRFGNTTQLTQKLTELGCNHLYLVFFPYQYKRNGNGGWNNRLYLIASAGTVSASWQNVPEVPYYLNLTLSGSSDIYYCLIDVVNNIDVNVSTGAASGYFTYTGISEFNTYSEPISGYIARNTYGTYALDNFSGGTVIEPDGDWPSAPVEPSPPELPTPTEPTVPVEPEPTIPEPTIPSDPIYIPVEAPDSTDYTDWLRAILEALNAIDDDLVTFASNVGDYFSAQNTFLRQIINEMATHCDHLQVRMHEEFAALTDYLNDLFTWLAGQMEFNFEGYDDTSVIGWLRKIYGRLGGGTYEPNPQADTPSFLDWLRDLWQRFFDALIGVLPSAIGDLVNDFQQLTRFFPFSIPWDLAALLGLFAHAPVTPVFDIPLPFGAGAGQTTSIHIDCTPWDGVAAMVRPCFLAMFCLQLALLTRDLLKGLNVTGGDE